MRLSHLFAVLLAVAGIGAVTPATAATSTTRLPVASSPLVQPGVPAASADQYRDRRGYRSRGYGYRGRSYGWRGGYRYRPRYYSYRARYYRPRYYRPRLVCRTSWRYGRPHRVCWR